MEPEKLSTESLLKSLDASYIATEAKHREVQKLIEEISKELQQRATAVYNEYATDWKKKTPLAKELIKGVIEPWVEEQERLGLWKALEQWSSRNKVPAIILTANVDYPYPYYMIKKVELDGIFKVESFTQEARFALEKGSNTTQFIEDRIKMLMTHQSPWHSWLRLKFSSELNREPVFTLNSYPYRGGCGWNVEVRRINPSKLLENLDSVHPDAWIGFAKQIKDGTVLRLLQELITKKQDEVQIDGMKRR